MTIIINYIQHIVIILNVINADCHSAQCHYVVIMLCHYAECRDHLNVMLSVVMLNVVMLSVVAH